MAECKPGERTRQQFLETCENKVINALTRREIQVFRLVIRGLRTVDIAKELSLSLSSINTYRRKALKRTAMNPHELIAVIAQYDILKELEGQ